MACTRPHQAAPCGPSFLGSPLGPTTTSRILLTSDGAACSPRPDGHVAMTFLLPLTRSHIWFWLFGR